MQQDESTATQKVQIPEGPFEPTWESLETYTIPDWYVDAKFGIFIHWGVYSVPAFGNEWYPRNMYQEGSAEFNHHVETYGPHKQFGYKDFIPQLTAEKFDAAEWADLFAKSGAKYIMPVAEHHDGFAMCASSFSKWNAVEMGPKRDIIGLLAEAVRARGMVFALSSHRAEHWWFMDGGMKFDSDVKDPEFFDFYGPAEPEGTEPNDEYLEDWLARTCELVDRYQPQVVWFDWWIQKLSFKPYLKRFAAYYYNRGAEWGKGVAINYKDDAYPIKAAMFDIERGQLTDIREPFWQTDTAVSKNSWGYITNQDYKAVTDVVHDLIDIVSKNGCMLLNIGPRPDGTIPEGDAEILLGIGQWLGINGEAIYGTRHWKVFGEGPTQVIGGGFNDTKREPFTSRDVRFTVKDDALYAIVLGWPEGPQITIQSLSTNLKLYLDEIGGVEMLGCVEPLKWTRDESGLNVTMPSGRPCEHAFVLKIAKKAPE
jgi:alpha-L-fucosidase